MGDLPDLYGVVRQSSLNFKDKTSIKSILNFRNKSLNFKDKTSSSLLGINLPRNKGFGNWEIHRKIYLLLIVCLHIFINNELVGILVSTKSLSE